MLTDPLPIKVADVVTSAGAATNHDKIGAGVGYSDYRWFVDGTSGTDTVRDIVELRVGNFQAGASNFDRRILVSRKVTRFNLTQGGVLVGKPTTVSITIRCDESQSTVSVASLSGAIRSLAHLLSNTTDEGIMAQLMNRET